MKKLIALLLALLLVCSLFAACTKRKKDNGTDGQDGQNPEEFVFAPEEEEDDGLWSKLR